MAEGGLPRPPDTGGTTQATVKSYAMAAGGTSTSGGRPFATITQNECIFPPIQLAARHYGTKEGKPSISFTPTELQVGEDHLKHSLVVKFAGGRPGITEVRQCFMQLWAISGRCSIGALDAKHILIVLESESDARRVLAHPTRKLGHSLFRIFRWSCEFSTNREPATTTSWIRLASLPPALNNPGYIASIVAAFGKYLAVDSRTRAFTNPNYARVCIEIDATKARPEEVWIATGTDSGFWQKVIYENTLLYCSQCQLHGHSFSNCRKFKQRQEAEQRVWDAGDELGLPIVKTKEAPPHARHSDDKLLSTSKDKHVAGRRSVPNKDKDSVLAVAVPAARRHGKDIEQIKDSCLVPDESQGWKVHNKKHRKKDPSSSVFCQPKTPIADKAPNVEKDNGPHLNNKDNGPLHQLKPTAVPCKAKNQTGNVGQKASPTPHSKFEQKATSRMLDSASKPHPTHCPSPTLADYGAKDVPISPLNEAPLANKGLDNINSKLSSCIIYNRSKSESMSINSPKSASRKSPAAPGFLSPRLLCLPIRDVQHSPSV